jgi:hypothetical protein
MVSILHSGEFQCGCARNIHTGYCGFLGPHRQDLLCSGEEVKIILYTHYIISFFFLSIFFPIVTYPTDSSQEYVVTVACVHTQRHTLTRQNSSGREICQSQRPPTAINPAGFKPASPTGKWLQSHVLDSSAIRDRLYFNLLLLFILLFGCIRPLLTLIHCMLDTRHLVSKF